MRFTLKQLEIFVQTAHHKSVTKAAEYLAMSQSAASGALKELESNFDIHLFDRVGKRLQLSELGGSVRPKAELLISIAKELEMSLVGEDEISSLAIGATLTIGNYLAVRLIADYMEAYPGAPVELEIANTQEIVRRVENFELDIGLVEGEINSSLLSVVPWYQDALVVFCAPSSIYESKPYLSDKDLKEASWILREQGSGTRQTFDRALSGILSQLSVRLELGHTEAIKQAVMAGLGLSCLSKLALQDSFDDNKLVPLKVRGRSFNRTWYIIQRKDKYRSHSLRNWLSVCDRYKNLS